MIDIEIIACLNDNYSFIIQDSASKKVAVIDPSEFTKIDKVISQKYKKLDYILNTHHHNDHIGGNAELKDKYKAKIVGSFLDKNRIPEIDITLKNNDKFKLGYINFVIFSVPGHTKGHIVFYSKEEKIVFTGDALFSLGCGRIFEGTYEQMFSSLNKFKSLPVDTKIYCGHEYTKSNFNFCYEYEQNNIHLKKKLKWINSRLKKMQPTIPTTIGDEINTNIFLRCNKQSLKKSLNMEISTDQEIFNKLRDLKDNF